MSTRILQGDCLEVLRTLESESVHCAVTSPPYWGLRSYIGENDPLKPCEIGLEPTYQLYIERMVEVFAEVRRVLRADGILWCNLGDCYATGAGKVGDQPGGGEQRWKGGPPSDKSTLRGNGHVGGGPKLHALDPVHANRGVHTAENSGKAAYRIKQMGPMTQPNRMPQAGLKAKDLCGIPWRVAFALQADGWYLRSALPWIKRNPMPESVSDRPTTAVEYVFLFSRSESYFYDYEAVQRVASLNTHSRLAQAVEAQIGSARAHAGGKTNGNMKAVRGKQAGHGRRHAGFNERYFSLPKSVESGEGIKNNDSMNEALSLMPEKRAMRNSDLFFDALGPITDDSGNMIALDVTTQPFKGSHFATFPPKLIKPLILAGCPKNGTILDPFGGAGTTGLVADRLGRNAILIELNPEYIAMARRRIIGDAGMFAEVEAP